MATYLDTLFQFLTTEEQDVVEQLANCEESWSTNLAKPVSPGLSRAEVLKKAFGWGQTARFDPRFTVGYWDNRYEELQREDDLRRLVAKEALRANAPPKPSPVAIVTEPGARTYEEPPFAVAAIPEVEALKAEIARLKEVIKLLLEK